jgi:hypothetical protein
MRFSEGTGLQAQNVSERLIKGRHIMFTLFKSLNFVGLGFLLALGALSLPARADDFVQNLGPVGPHEPILATVGGKRVIAFYEPRSGQCGMNVVVWNSADASGASAARVRVSLDPRQIVHIDSADNKSIDLQCGDYAETLSLIENSTVVTATSAH